MRAGSSGWKFHNSGVSGWEVEESSDVKKTFLSLTVPPDPLGPFAIRGLETGGVYTVTQRCLLLPHPGSSGSLPRDHPA